MEIIREFVDELVGLIKSTGKYLKFGIIFLAYLLISIVRIIPLKFFNMDVDTISPLTDSLLTIFSRLILILIIYLFYNKKINQDFKKLLGMKKEKRHIVFDTAFRYWLIGLIIMIESNFLLSKFGLETASNDQSVRNMLELSPIIAPISVVLLSPFIEEVVFRLSFKEIFKGKWTYILISGFIFGGMHVFFNVNSFYDLLFLIPYCSLGFAFAATYHNTDNIWVSTIIHIIHNFITFFIAYIMAGGILW